MFLGFSGGRSVQPRYRQLLTQGLRSMVTAGWWKFDLPRSEASRRQENTGSTVKPFARVGTLQKWLDRSICVWSACGPCRDPRAVGSLVMHVTWSNNKRLWANLTPSQEVGGCAVEKEGFWARVRLQFGTKCSAILPAPEQLPTRRHLTCEAVFEGYISQEANSFLSFTMAPKYVKIQPSLPVTSIPDAIAYYTDCLGFRLAGRDGDNHCWVQLVDGEDVSKWDAAVNIYLRRMSRQPTISQ